MSTVVKNTKSQSLLDINGLSEDELILLLNSSPLGYLCPVLDILDIARTGYQKDNPKIKRLVVALSTLVENNPGTSSMYLGQLIYHLAVAVDNRE